MQISRKYLGFFRDLSSAASERIRSGAQITKIKYQYIKISIKQGNVILVKGSSHNRDFQNSLAMGHAIFKICMERTYRTIISTTYQYFG